MRRGIAYGVGVGPGDPELMTLKAIRLIRETGVVALPGDVPRETVAYKIAVAAVPELAGKELVPVSVPMVKDRERIDREHRRAAKLLESYLDQGRDVVYLTLGDPAIYCTFSYIQHHLEADGYPTALVPGIPSFCAAAARLNVPLCEWDEPLHIVPAVHHLGEALDREGNYVLMKSASRMVQVRETLRQSGRKVMMVENCGMPGEKVCRDVNDIPDEAGYFSVIIAKEN